MTLSAADLRELELALGERLYLQLAGWHLYLKDAGLAQTLAMECAARLDQGAEIAARQALEAVQVPIGGGATRLPMARFVRLASFGTLRRFWNPFADRVAAPEGGLCWSSRSPMPGRSCARESAAWVAA